MREEEFASYFVDWREPWELADAETTASRLADAGFEEIQTSVEWSPVVFPDDRAFSTFITNVICRPHLAYLPNSMRDLFIARVTALAAKDEPPFELDYRRLNMQVRKPR
jgi:hypothetical protein